MPIRRSRSSPISGESRASRTGVPPAREVGGSGGLRHPHRRSDVPESERPSRRRSVALFCLLVLLLFALPLGWVLASRGVGYQTHLLEHWSTDNPRFLGHGPRARSVPMERGTGGVNGYSHRIEFVETTSLPRVGLRSIDLQFDVRQSDDPHSEIPGVTRMERAQLRDLDGDGIWTSRPVGRLRTETMVEFLTPDVPADKGPAEGPSSPVHRRWQLEVWTHDPVLLGVRCHLTYPVGEGPASPDPGKWSVTVRGEDGKMRWAYPHGRYTTWIEGERRSRAALVAALWGRSSAIWTWAWLSGATVSIMAGVVLMVRSPTATSLRAGVALAAIFGGFGLMHLILTPAFLGVDEPVHVMTSQGWMGDGVSVTNSWEYGKKVHYARLFGRPDQKFTEADVDHPHDWFIDSPANWGLRPAERSAVFAKLTQATYRWVAGRPAAEQVFRMRLISLMLVTLAVGSAGALLSRGNGVEPGKAWMGWCLVLVPALGYFAMNVSNYSVLLAGYVVMGSICATVVNQDSIRWWVMAVMGLCLGTVMQTALNGVLMALVPGAALLGLAMFRPKPISEASEDSQERPVGWVGWASLAGGLLVARVFRAAEFDGVVWLTMGKRLEGVIHFPLPSYAVLVLLACSSLAVIERVAAWCCPFNAGDGRGRGMDWVGALSLAVVAGLLFNAIRPAPQLGMLMEAVPAWEFLPNQGNLLPRADLVAPPDPSPSPKAYAWSAVKSFAASWGPGDADFMTSRLFWQACGFLDSLAPEWVRWFLTTLFALGVAIQLWRISRRKNRVRFGRLFLLGAALLTSVVLLAVGARMSLANPSLHGRYLIGVYVMLIPVAFLGWKGWFLRWEVRRPTLLALLLVVPLLGLQLSSVLTMLFRYFG